MPRTRFRFLLLPVLTLAGAVTFAEENAPPADLAFFDRIVTFEAVFPEPEIRARYERREPVEPLAREKPDVREYMFGLIPLPGMGEHHHSVIYMFWEPARDSFVPGMTPFPKRRPWDADFAELGFLEGADFAARTFDGHYDLHIYWGTFLPDSFEVPAVDIERIAAEMMRRYRDFAGGNAPPADLAFIDRIVTCATVFAAPEMRARYWRDQPDTRDGIRAYGFGTVWQDKEDEVADSWVIVTWMRAGMFDRPPMQNDDMVVGSARTFDGLHDIFVAWLKSDDPPAAVLGFDAGETARNLADAYRRYPREPEVFSGDAAAGCAPFPPETAKESFRRSPLPDMNLSFLDPIVTLDAVFPEPEARARHTMRPPENPPEMPGTRNYTFNLLALPGMDERHFSRITVTWEPAGDHSASGLTHSPKRRPLDADLAKLGFLEYASFGTRTPDGLYNLEVSWHTFLPDAFELPVFDVKEAALDILRRYSVFVYRDLKPFRHFDVTADRRFATLRLALQMKLIMGKKNRETNRFCVLGYEWENGKRQAPIFWQEGQEMFWWNGVGGSAHWDERWGEVDPIAVHAEQNVLDADSVAVPGPKNYGYLPLSGDMVDVDCERNGAWYVGETQTTSEGDVFDSCRGYILPRAGADAVIRDCEENGVWQCHRAVRSASALRTRSLFPARCRSFVVADGRMNEAKAFFLEDVAAGDRGLACLQGETFNPRGETARKRASQRLLFRKSQEKGRQDKGQ
ncbi:MAG: hypothetical protein LBF93_01920 [Zoogloeaceae bacterium]|jgi:hypothetical protein|nr:hypothetical protein [Zoogloeaceae bacterium]